MKKEITASEKRVEDGNAVIITTQRETLNETDLRNNIMMANQQLSDLINQMNAIKARFDELKAHKTDLENLLAEIASSTVLPEIPKV
jgi:uncharacterized protein involved in exopolysaccharide biosynthesis